MAKMNNAINANINNQLFYTTMTLNSSQITNMFSTPVQFLPAPGPNKVIQIRNWGFALHFNTTAYAGGGLTGLYYGNARANIAGGTFTVGNMTTSASICNSNPGTTVIIPGSNSINTAIYISNATGAFTTGDSSITVYAFYSIVSFDSSITTNCVNDVGGNYYVKKAYIPSASVQNLNTTPITIVPAPGSGFAIVPERAIFMLNYNSVAYNTSGVQISYGSTGQTVITANSSLLSGSVVQWNQAIPSLSNAAPANLNNQPLVVTASVSPGTSGNSDLIIYVNYSIVAL